MTQDPYRWYSVEELQKEAAQQRRLKDSFRLANAELLSVNDQLWGRTGVLERRVAIERIAGSVIIWTLCVTLFFAL